MCEERHVFTGGIGITETAFYLPVTVPFALLSNIFTFYPAFPLYLLNNGLTINMYPNL